MMNEEWQLLLLLVLLHVCAPSSSSPLSVHLVLASLTLTPTAGAAAAATATAASTAAWLRAARWPLTSFRQSWCPCEPMRRSSSCCSYCSSSSSSSRGALWLQMASSKPRPRAPATRPLQRMRQQEYELRVALQQKNRCLYTPLPPQQQQQQLQQRFPVSLQQMRVPLAKQKKQKRWLVEKRTKLAWRQVQQHLQQLPQQLQQQQTLLLPPEQQQEVNTAAAAHDKAIHDAVWRSFIATRVVPRLALLARQQEKPQLEEFEALQEQQQLLLNERRQQQQQQQQDGSILRQVRGMRRRLKASLRRDAGYALSEQQQLYALLGLRVPVEAAEGAEAAAAAAAAAAKAWTLAQQTRQPFLQFLVDLHHVFEQLETLQQQPPQHYCDLLLQQQQQEPHQRDEGDSAEQSAQHQEQQQQQQRRAALRDFLSMTPPTRADRLLADVQAFARLLELEPPAASQEARGLVAALRDLHEENFTRRCSGSSSSRKQQQVQQQEQHAPAQPYQQWRITAAATAAAAPAAAGSSSRQQQQHQQDEVFGAGLQVFEGVVADWTLLPFGPREETAAVAAASYCFCVGRRHRQPRGKAPDAAACVAAAAPRVAAADARIAAVRVAVAALAAAAACVAVLRVAIDSLALLWRRRPPSSSSFEQQQQHECEEQQEVFLQELDGADLHFRQALVTPLMRALREKAVSVLGVKPRG
ncbi:hypothetical protein Emag_004539 [Eimeria magna]